MEISAAVDEALEPTLGLLERLIAEASIDGSDTIGRCLDHIEEALESLAGTRRRHTFQGLPNLVAQWGDPADRRRLILAGYTDVVPAEGEWQTDPFSLVRNGDTLIGRGVCDMKDAVAAYVGALTVAARHTDLDRLPVSLVITGDEEVGSHRGMVPLLDGGHVTGRWALCGEPTGLAVFTGNRGVVWLRIKITGQGGHAGLGHALHNPMWAAARAITALEAVPLNVHDERFTPPAPSLNVTWLHVEGERATNTIPDAVWLAVDRRLLPGERPEAAVSAIDDALTRAVAEPFRWELTLDRIVPPYIADDGDPLVDIAQWIVRQVGRRGALGTDPAADDSSWLGNAGIATILCGPGAPEQAHTTGEYVDVSEIRDAIAIYAQLILIAATGYQ